MFNNKHFRAQSVANTPEEKFACSMSNQANESFIENSNSSANLEEKKVVAQSNEEKKLAKQAKFLAKQASLQASKAITATEAVKPVNEALKPKTESSQVCDLTPVGEKKILSSEMAAGYDPKAVESSWYSWWEKEGFFKPEYYQDGTDREKFVIAIPPPNVTGSLHLGHAMMTAIQDSIVRWRRMQGKQVLYVPGCDHAGISCQVVVEKKLKKEKGLLKHDLGREKFVDEIWKWKEQYGDRIYEQFRSLGSSVDWDRKKFTLDPDMNQAVNFSFVKLHDQGLIFRENRLVHWSSKIQTSVSDLEVDHQTIPGRTWMSVAGSEKKYEFGVLTKVAYQVVGFDEKIIVATTRPETIIGDTAIAVNPKDQRYTKFFGKFAINPITGKEIPIICDEHADMEFGTGALKITPAHDYNDFEIGKRHQLEFINIFDEKNQINQVGGKFQGMNRFDARVAIVQHLKETGHFISDEAYEITLPICNRSGDIIEPRLKAQWWLNCKAMAKKAADAVRNKELKIIPEESEKTWFYWLDNIKDWCLSRQLWWGHRVPAYLVKIKGQNLDEMDNSSWIAAESMEQAWDRVLIKFPNIPTEEISLIQDEDVLDTWYSSGLWPFAILGWPKNTKDIELYYPTTILETGRDIIFFWVARMVMLGLELTGKLPFKTILLHSIVRDAHGRKMSKSLGNVIDPLDVINGISLEDLQKQLEKGNLDLNEVKLAKEGQKKDFPKGIPQCGSDALRFALCACTSFTRDVNLDILRVEGYRKFCNKIWNATKFSLMRFENFKPEKEFNLSGSEQLSDLWILSRLNSAFNQVDQALEEYNFMQATTAIHKFILYELCDVYLEVIKGQPESRKETIQQVLYYCLESALLLLHPFMPFITEELFQRLPKRPLAKPSISVSLYPSKRSDLENLKAEQDFGLINEIVYQTRVKLAEKNLRKNFKVSISHAQAELLTKEKDSISNLLKGISNLTIAQGDNSIETS